VFTQVDVLIKVIQGSFAPNHVKQEGYEYDGALAISSRICNKRWVSRSNSWPALEKYNSILKLLFDHGSQRPQS